MSAAKRTEKNEECWNGATYKNLLYLSNLFSLSLLLEIPRYDNFPGAWSQNRSLLTTPNTFSRSLTDKARG